MAESPPRTRPDAFSVVCPLCGALPNELCDRGTRRSLVAHDARLGEATRIMVLSAPNVIESL